jgi:hypothetical protein
VWRHYTPCLGCLAAWVVWTVCTSRGTTAMPRVCRPTKGRRTIQQWSTTSRGIMLVVVCLCTALSRVIETIKHIARTDHAVRAVRYDIMYLRFSYPTYDHIGASYYTMPGITLAPYILWCVCAHCDHFHDSNILHMHVYVHGFYVTEATTGGGQPLLGICTTGLMKPSGEVKGKATSCM